MQNFPTLMLLLMRLLLLSFPYGAVIHKADGPTPTSEFRHSSIPETVKKLFNLSSNFLTKRDAWAGTFEKYLRLRDTPWDNCPVTLLEVKFSLRPHGPKEDSPL
ncbi:hypothetical protein Drorol1_Dr00027445 [Drosera rotundifolia]